jgi:hypothetical protein
MITLIHLINYINQHMHLWLEYYPNMTNHQFTNSFKTIPSHPWWNLSSSSMTHTSVGRP